MRQVRSLERVVVLALLLLIARTVSAQSLIQIDRRSAVSRADLTYETPAARSEEGMP